MTIFLLSLALISTVFIIYGAHKALRQGSAEDALSGLPLIGAGFLGLILTVVISLFWSLASVLTS